MSTLNLKVSAVQEQMNFNKFEGNPVQQVKKAVVNEVLNGAKFTKVISYLRQNNFETQDSIWQFGQSTRQG
jgi:hypothetical protein